MLSTGPVQRVRCQGMLPCVEMLWFPRGDWKPSAEQKWKAAGAASSPAVSPARQACMQSTSLCFDGFRTGGSLLWGQSSTSTHPPYERPHPEAQTASLRLSRALMMQQRLLHLTWYSVCHYLEAEIRGCPVLQQILFSKLCLWSPPERAHFLDSSPKQRHRVCTGRTEEPPSCKGLVNF